MTREEAINIMKVIVHMLEEKYDTDRVEDAVDMAIEALSAEPCEDCISREYILSKAHCCCDDLSDDEPCCVDVDDIKNAPSVQPIRPKGEWIGGVAGWECSHCGYGVFAYNNTEFCPKCGADMRGTE